MPVRCPSSGFRGHRLTVGIRGHIFAAMALRSLWLSVFILSAAFLAAVPVSVSQARPAGTPPDSLLYSSASLEIRKVSARVAVHTSFLETESYGKVPCNGMIVFDAKQAVVFDTPANPESSRELIRYLNGRNIAVRAVIATHFHADCVAGLAEFHRHKIPSFAEDRTIAILRRSAAPAALPQSGFADSLAIPVGRTKVQARYFGAGHTRDNIIGYFADEHVLFGGCLIKEAGASKGNLEDADLAEWPRTVGRIRSAFPDVQVVVPGHGKTGTAALLDYTIKLFR